MREQEIRFDWATQNILHRMAVLRAKGEERSEAEQGELDRLSSEPPANCAPLIQLLVNAGLLYIRVDTKDPSLADSQRRFVESEVTVVHPNGSGFTLQA